MSLISKIKWHLYDCYLKRFGLSAKKLGGIGYPMLDIHDGAKVNIQGRLYTVNTYEASTLGVNRKCKLSVYPNAELNFLGNVGMSNTVVVATKSITIGSNVMIGGGTTIVDSDFHSLDPGDWFTPRDAQNMNSAPVVIGDNVFIGMDVLILKGVTIGEGAIVAARSVVSKSIPAGEVWGGNPAKFIRKKTV